VVEFWTYKSPLLYWVPSEKDFTKFKMAEIRFGLEFGGAVFDAVDKF
jgi:hypothetical protein